MSGAIPDMPPCWVSFGIDLPNKLVYVLGLDADKAEAKRHALDRAKEHGVEGEYSVTVIGMHEPMEMVDDKMKCWLAANDIIGANADQLIREVKGSLVKVLDEVARENGWTDWG